MDELRDMTAAADSAVPVDLEAEAAAWERENGATLPDLGWRCLDCGGSVQPMGCLGAFEMGRCGNCGVERFRARPGR